MLHLLRGLLVCSVGANSFEMARSIAGWAGGVKGKQSEVGIQ